MSTPTRRDFLKKLVFGPGADNSPASNASTSGSSQTINKAGTIVYIFLRGGADTLNMFVPYGDSDYYKSRPTIAVKHPQKGVADCAIKVTDFYGFHPKLAPLVPIFSEGRLGIVQSVGSDNPSGSHFEAQDQIEHGVACGQQYSGGWLGRHLQSRARFATSPLCAVAIGATLPESMRGAPSASAITSIDTIRLEAPSADSKAVASALASLYRCDIALLRAPGRDTLDLLRKVENLRDQKYHSTASYPDTDFGRGLREVARLVKANVGLEIASIDLSGWDTHFFQGSVTGIQATLIDELARSLAAFDKDTIEHQNSVTVIVQTEFGRRTYENSSLGTDHGRGFALMAIGNNVNGGTIHGDWKGLSKQDIDIIGPAGLPINYDYRSVLSELLICATGNNHQISEVFPNFTPQPVGLMKSGSPPLA